MTVTTLHSAANDNGGGIQFHSTDTPYRSFVVFAIDALEGVKEPHQQTLARNQFKMWCQSNGLNVKELVGSWKGKRETAWIMGADDFANFHVDTVWCKGQEAILHLGPTGGPTSDHAGFRLASLISGGEVTPLGRWQAVPEAVALAQDGWTFDPTQFGGVYWIAGEPKPEPRFGAFEAQPDPRAPGADILSLGAELSAANNARDAWRDDAKRWEAKARTMQEERDTALLELSRLKARYQSNPRI